jgi:hypothetical protein
LHIGETALAVLDKLMNVDRKDFELGLNDYKEEPSDAR